MKKIPGENKVGENSRALNLGLKPLPVPEPMPNADAYHAERRLRIESDKACRENYDKYLKSGRKSESADYLPIKLDIENVSRCNFKCKMCQVSEWHKGKRADDMSFQDFKKIIDEQYGLVEIKLQGMGEPLMAGDDFFSMIRYARNKHIWVRSVTNASLLHLNDNYRNFIDSGINELQVSIDGADKYTFESIRGGSNFQKVKENCQLLNSYCREVGLNLTKMWTVVQQNNIHQLFELVEFASATGFKSQVFSLDLTDWGQEKWRSIHDRHNQVDGINPETSWKLVAYGKKLGVKVSFWNISEKYRAGSLKTICSWPFERAFVSSDLRIVPCCMIANPDVMELGEASSGFSKVWQSDVYSKFRRDHLSGNIPRACKACYQSD
jgi:pyrroloquinoline quinone biosynthesis protein E